MSDYSTAMDRYERNGLVIESDQNIIMVTLDRISKRNAFDEPMMRGMIRLFEDPPAATRCIVLTGSESVFCAGADLTWMANNPDRTTSAFVARLFESVRACRLPVVARINGPAIGGGVGLTACCDVAVASQQAFFQLSEVRVGILPAVISPFVMEKIGPGRLRQWMLTAQRIDAATANQWGLIAEVVPAEQLDETVQRYVSMILAGAPQAQAEAKKLAARLYGLYERTLLDETIDMIASLRASDEAQQRMATFLDSKSKGNEDQS